MSSPPSILTSGGKGNAYGSTEGSRVLSHQQKDIVDVVSNSSNETESTSWGLRKFLILTVIAVFVSLVGIVAFSKPALDTVGLRGETTELNEILDHTLFDCALYDDDGVFGSNILCTEHDVTGFCTNTCIEGTKCYEYCASACDYTLDNDDLESYKNISSWANPCMWQVLTNMKSACAGDLSFITVPEGSKNLDPKRTTLLTPDNVLFEQNGEEVDVCEVHSYCMYCNDDNKYCTAIANYYNDYTTNYGPIVAIENMETFWCTEGVIDSIEDGTFNEKYVIPKRRLQKLEKV